MLWHDLVFTAYILACLGVLYEWYHLMTKLRPKKARVIDAKTLTELNQKRDE